MINEIDILHESHSGYFSCHSGEKSAGLLCIITYHHKTVVELGENGLNPFSELSVCPCRRSPILLVQPIRNVQSNVGNVKKILLHFGAEIAFVTKHHAVMIFPLHILEVMEVVDTCSCHVEGMDNECLCKAMVDFNMIDTVSRGIKKMFNEQWRRHFPMPDYEIDAAKKKVVVRIYGNEINKRYTDLLKTDNTLSLWDCISLDAVQKGRFIHENVAKDLLNRGLIEGDAPNYTISLGVAKATRQLQGYTKQKGLDKDKIKQMILQYLKNAGSDGAKRDGIYEYIKDVMPQAKTREQQLRILGDILNALSVDKLISANGRTWFLNE